MANTNNFQTISNTSAYPYSALAYIISTFPDGARVQGSGVLIGANDVLTASHMVYSVDNGGAAVSVTVIPAYNSGIQPYGSFDGSYIHYHVLNNVGGLLDSKDITSDVAVVALSSPVGLRTGFFGLDPNFSAGQAYAAGYPGVQNGNLTVSSAYTTAGSILNWNIDTGLFYISPGSSGGPIYELVNTIPYVVGVVSTGPWGAPIAHSNAYSQVLDDIRQDRHYVASSLPTMNVADQAVTAGSGISKTLNYQVSQSYSLPMAGDFNVTSKDGTGLAGVDYDAVNSTLRMASGATSTSLSLNIHPNWDAHPGTNRLDFHLDFADPQLATFAGYSMSHESTISITRGEPVQRSINGKTTQILNGSMSNYTVQQSQNNLTVTDTVGQEGTFTCLGVNRLQFNDKALAFDFAGEAGQSYRIYQAAFNRQPDQAGLGYWIAQMDKGASLVNVAAGFIASPEFQQLYGANPSTKQLVDGIYSNVLHRNPDAAGEAFYIGQIDSGQKSAAKVLADFSESPENQLQVAGSIQHGIGYMPWLG